MELLYTMRSSFYLKDFGTKMYKEKIIKIDEKKYSFTNDIKKLSFEIELPKHDGFVKVIELLNIPYENIIEKEKVEEVIRKHVTYGDNLWLSHRTIINRILKDLGIKNENKKTS